MSLSIAMAVIIRTVVIVLFSLALAVLIIYNSNVTRIPPDPVELLGRTGKRGAQRRQA